MKLIDKQTALRFFDAPSREELGAWCRQEKYGGIDPTWDYPVGDMPSDYILAAALWYARKRYPDADPLDICSYAGLVAYFATGWYGGFGTECYEKERQAENIVLALAGGMAAPPDGVVATIPEEVVKRVPSVEFTCRVLEFLDAFYFGDQERAVTDMLGGVDDLTAARIVLGLARTQAKYKRLARVADEFLKKKTNISSLRKAVRKVLEKPR